MYSRAVRNDQGSDPIRSEAFNLSLKNLVAGVYKLHKLLFEVKGVAPN